MNMTLLPIGIGFALGAILVLIVSLLRSRTQSAKLVQLSTQLQTEAASHQQQMAALEASHRELIDQTNCSHNKEKDDMANQYRQMYDEQQKVMNLQLQTQKSFYEKKEQQMRESYETRMAEQRATMEQQLKEQKATLEQQLSVLRVEFENLSKEHLQQQEKGLKEVNQEQLNHLLQPLREHIESFAKAFSENKEAQVKSQVVFQEAIKTLVEQTTSLGKDAQQLAEALKSDSKKQGNWGEMVLNNILEASGLERGRDFFPQAAETVDDGRLIPDVKVRIPQTDDSSEGAFVVIDSKVSLTAYMEYVHAETEEQRAESLKRHLLSVRKHVDELASKDYVGRLNNTFGPVLMFVPNEGSFLLAVQNDSQLLLDAYRKKVILLNPSNLMLALQLVYLLHQTQRQSKNVESVVKSATGIYEKLATFANSFAEIENRIKSLQTCYSQAKGQLVTGKGNLIRRFEEWKDLGITPGKTIPNKLLEEPQIIDEASAEE